MHWRRTSCRLRVLCLVGGGSYRHDGIQIIAICWAQRLVLCQIECQGLVHSNCTLGLEFDIRPTASVACSRRAMVKLTEVDQWLSSFVSVASFAIVKFVAVL